MVMLAETLDAVSGADTHTDTHTACLLDRLGREIATVTVPADPGCYAALIAWAVERSPGSLLVWALEGTRSHGVGLVRALRTAGQLLIEAGRPSRVSRRPGGRSDPADAHDALAVATPAPPREVAKRCIPRRAGAAHPRPPTRVRSTGRVSSALRAVVPGVAAGGPRRTAPVTTADTNASLAAHQLTSPATRVEADRAPWSQPRWARRPSRTTARSLGER